MRYVAVFASENCIRSTALGILSGFVEVLSMDLSMFLELIEGFVFLPKFVPSMCMSWTLGTPKMQQVQI